jgi:hypothetical protein
MAPSLATDPAALDRLATLVDGRVGDIASARSAFRGPALDVGDAFGFLGPSPDLLRDYLELAQGTVGALGELQHTLSTMAAGLRATAAGYRQAEAANTVGP